jgi:ribosome assembly protein YihI (activator of Der GTPase)
LRNKVTAKTNSNPYKQGLTTTNKGTNAQHTAKTKQTQTKQSGGRSHNTQSNQHQQYDTKSPLKAIERTPIPFIEMISHIFYSN